jgi:hypothetical protein
VARGVPVTGQRLFLVVESDGKARRLTFDGGFRSAGPLTGVANKRSTVVFVFGEGYMNEVGRSVGI